MISLIRTLRFLAAALLATGAHAAELRVSAAASLGETMTEISALYEKTVGETLQLNFGGSNALARQIEAGAPCDLFFSADEASIKQLLAKNLLHENSITPLLGNSLVVIVPTGSPLKISAASDLSSPQIRRLALGDPAAVPAGVYARQWLESRKVWDSISPKVVAAENVRGALAAVSSGNVEAGIVYKTDAMTSTQVAVAFEVPAGETPAIVYPIAATKSSTDPGKAIRFIGFLKQPAAAAIFNKHGFATFSPGAEQ